MRRSPFTLAALTAVAILAAPAAAQPPGAPDAAVLEELCAANARTDFEYQVCLMVVHTMLVPEPFNPEPSGTYAPDRPQGAEGAPEDLAASPTASASG